MNMHSQHIDFDSINQAALVAARSLLPQIIPGGKFRSLEYIARNPRRDDQTPGSFSINYKSGVWKDFATEDGGGDLISLVAYMRGSSQGDAARELADKLGLALHKPAVTNGHSHSDRPIPIGATESTPKVYPWGDDGPPARDEARRHVYRNGNGLPVRIKIKRSDGTFVNWYRVCDGDNPTGWQPKKPDDFVAVPYVSAAIYPFDPELIGDEVFWPEGEKDVDTLSSINFPAFCFGGVGDGLPAEIGHYLKDRRLVIFSDNDDPGRAHAEKKAAVARAAGAASIKIVHFSDLPPKGDVSDFIKGGATVEQLLSRIDSTPAWSPAPPQLERPSEASSPAGWRTKIVMANDLQAMTFPPVRHIVPGYISEGVTILAGKPKIGKSWLTLDLCLAATADRFTLGTLKPTQGDVLYLALEDNNRRLKKRMGKLWPLRDARWPARLALVTDWKRADEGGLEDIEEWLGSVTDPVMVVIDTLEKFRPIQKGNSAAYSADYTAVTGLQKLAGKHGIAIVINHHVRKMEAEDPFDTVSGTLGLTGAADTIIVLKRQAGAVTLHARGRDIEEVETALQFERATCRWTILGAAAEVHMSHERGAIVAALEGAGTDGLAVSEIMIATGSSSRGATYTLLFKMKEAGEVTRLKRGVYALAQDAGKIGEKERNWQETPVNIEENDNLSNLTDLTALSASDAVFDVSRASVTAMAAAFETREAANE